MVSAVRASGRRLIDLGIYVEKRFRADGAFNMASSLSYSSLLSLVPLLAIGLAILAAFPVFDQVRDELQANVFRAVVPEVGEQVQRYVGAYVKNAGKLTAAGVVGLATSAIMVLVAIESSLNRIFRVATARTTISRVLVYWTALTLGPLLLGASFSISAWLYAASDIASQARLGGITRLLTHIAPTGLLMLTFGLMYLAVPNRRVQVADAMTGGVAAGIAFAVLRWVFSLYVVNAKSYQSIYGAVALVPIFLFWMYVSWMVVLFGAELAAALPEWRLARHDLGGHLPPRRRLAIALTVLAALLDESRRAGKGRSRVQLLQVVGEAEREFLAVLECLCRDGYAVRTAAGRYVLGRDLTAVTLADVVHLLGLGLGPREAEDCVQPWMRRIASRLAEAAQAEAEALDLPLRAILEEAGSRGLCRLADAHEEMAGGDSR